MLHGFGNQEYSKLNDSIYWRDQEGVYVNLFIPSELEWAEKGFKVRQETQYPESQEVTLTVTAARPENMALRLRIPGWLQSAPTVKLNEKVLDASAAPGSYLTLSRVWKTGDKVEMQLPCTYMWKSCRMILHAGVSIWTSGSGRRPRRGGADRSPHHWTELAGRRADSRAARLPVRTGEQDSSCA